jgi:hypothetical protein
VRDDFALATNVLLLVYQWERIILPLVKVLSFVGVAAGKTAVAAVVAKRGMGDDWQLADLKRVLAPG